ncbi:MAG: transposase family protein [bacterium]|nr:transposase family protein [bacterium]
MEVEGEVRERRNQLRHPVYAKPELVATAADQVWTWDLTKLKGPVKWTYYYLYVILDLYGRYVKELAVVEPANLNVADQLAPGVWTTRSGAANANWGAKTARIRIRRRIIDISPAVLGRSGRS